MKSESIRVGLITGAGGAHLGAYFSALASCEDVESVAVADSSGQAFQSAKKTLGGRFNGTYLDVEEMLNRVKPKMVLVSMEAATAPPAIELALKHDCHVFAEKPSCIRAADFFKLVELADSKHKYLMLALANRLNPEIQEARRLLQSGAIGKVYGLEMHIIADQTRLTRTSYHKSWFAKKSRAGGGHLIWLGIHWLDLAMYVTGSRVVQASGFTGNVGGQPIDVEDSAAATLKFDNGSFGTLTSGYYLDRGYHSHIKIWGSQGWMLIQPTADDLLQWSTTKGDKAGQIQHYLGPKQPRGYTPFVHAAVRACAGEDAPPISNSDSRRAIQTVFGIYRAADSGMRQAIE